MVSAKSVEGRSRGRDRREAAWWCEDVEKEVEERGHEGSC